MHKCGCIYDTCAGPSTTFPLKGSILHYPDRISVLSYYFTFFLVTRISCLVDLESSLHFQLVSLLDYLEFSALLLRPSDK